MAKVSRLHPQNAAVWSFPAWLPDAVRNFVISCAHAAEHAEFEKIQLDGGIREIQTRGAMEAQIWHVVQLRDRLQRLTTDTKMRSVWKHLSSVPLKPPSGCVSSPEERRKEVLRHFISLALAWIAPSSQQLSDTPAINKQQRSLKRVALQASKLLELMRSPSDVSGYTPWNTLDSLAERLMPIDVRPAGRSWPYGDNSLEAIWPDIGDLQHVFQGTSWNGTAAPRSLRYLFPKFDLQLKVLADPVWAESVAKLNPPHKRSKARFRVWYIRRLAAYIEREFAQPLHQAIATTTNTALEPKPKVTRQHVQKLLDESNARSPTRKEST